MIIKVELRQLNDEATNQVLLSGSGQAPMLALRVEP
jgi:hypothetical protein